MGPPPRFYDQHPAAAEHHGSRLRTHPTWEPPHAGPRARHAASPERHVPRAAPHEAPGAGARAAWGRPRASGPTPTGHALAPTRCRLTPHGVRARAHATCKSPPRCVHAPPRGARGAPRRACRQARSFVFANRVRVGAHGWCFRSHDATEASHAPRAHRHAVRVRLYPALRSPPSVVNYHPGRSSCPRFAPQDGRSRRLEQTVGSRRILTCRALSPEDRELQ